MAIYLSSSLGYKVNDALSLDTGAALVYGDLEMDLNGITPSSQISIDGDDTEFTFHLSALIEFNKTTRLGITYWYETKLNFSKDLHWSGTCQNEPFACFFMGCKFQKARGYQE